MKTTEENGLVPRAVLDAAKVDLGGSLNSEMRSNRISRTVDKMIEAVGFAFSWLWLVLLAVIILNVILRYVFRQGMIELEELQWYLYAAAWLFGLSYTFVFDGHVRVDVLHDRLSLRARMWLELCGLLVLFLPFTIFVLIYTYPFVELSWMTSERSTSANGLPARWLIKGCLLAAFAFLTLAGLARLSRVIETLRFGGADQKAGG